MPWYRVNGMDMHVKLGGGRGRAALPCRAPDGPAHRCCGISAYLCDWPVGDGEHTCDMPLCASHALQAGTNLHYCPAHAALWQQQQLQLPLNLEVKGGSENG